MPFQSQPAQTPKLRLKLSYFPCRGRSEAPLLLLIDAGVAATDVPHPDVIFTDVRIQPKEWRAMKADGRVGPAHGHPFGQIPTLEVSEAEGTDSESFTLAETATILGYLDATLPGVRYLPATALEQAKLDMVRDAAMNQLASLYRSIWKPDWPSEPAKRACWTETVVPFLTHLEYHIQKVGLKDVLGGPGHRLTVAAAVLFDALDIVQSLYDGLAEYPVLRAVYDAVRMRPAIAAYLRSGKRNEKVTMSPYEVVQNSQESQS